MIMSAFDSFSEFIWIEVHHQSFPDEPVGLFIAVFFTFIESLLKGIRILHLIHVLSNDPVVLVDFALMLLEVLNHDGGSNWSWVHIG